MKTTDSTAQKNDDGMSEDQIRRWAEEHKARTDEEPKKADEVKREPSPRMMVEVR